MLTNIERINNRIRKHKRHFKLDGKLQKVKKTMYTPPKETTKTKTASDQLKDMAHWILGEVEKSAFVPGQEIGMDPAAGGMPPGMDPAMMQGGMPPMPPGMDPAMMGMDPAAMGMDPAMMQAPPMEEPLPPPTPEPAPAPSSSPEAEAEAAQPVAMADFEALQEQVGQLEKTILDLMDMVESTGAVAPNPEPDPAADPAAQGGELAAPMGGAGGPFGQGANAAMGQLKMNNLGSPDALGRLITKLNG